MQPIYTPHNTTPAFQLNWALTLFWREKPIDDATWLRDLQRSTEPNGVRVIKHRLTTGDASQFFVSTKPHVAPSDVVRSVKGRLQYLVRSQAPKAFQRNYSVRSIGEAKRSTVEDYVANQLGHHRMADPAVQERLARFQRAYARVDLSKACFSAHGQYWHNLHLVIVNQSRWMEIHEDSLRKVIDMIEGVAAKYGYRPSRVGLLADHLHITLGCMIDRSPEHVALSYMNNCAYVYGMKPVFAFSYYAGTIGEYDRGAVQ
jgi:REP element-mobilizing transposase RayT